MIDALLSLIPGNSLAVTGGAIAAALALAWRIFASGRATERARQADRDMRAMEEQLEMHREADAFERRMRDLRDEEARKEAMKWSRPR